MSERPSEGPGASAAASGGDDDNANASVSPECIFCRVVSGQLPSREALSGPLTYAFHDLEPKAPLHVLVVPRQHIADASGLGPEHAEVVAEMMVVARTVAQNEGYGRSGYRLTFNVGPDAGNQVPHLHMHVMAGRELGWPPG